jgi:fructose-bisphosphate aldolase class 1
MDIETQLRQRLSANEVEIAKCRERTKELELEQHRLSIALEVFVQMGSSAVAAKKPTVEQPVAVGETDQATAAHVAKAPIKKLVLDQLQNAGFALTKMDVVSRLVASGHQVNSASIGSTLSKLVESGAAEKAGHSSYRVKSEPLRQSSPPNNKLSKFKKQRSSVG